MATGVGYNPAERVCLSCGRRITSNDRLCETCAFSEIGREGALRTRLIGILQDYGINKTAEALNQLVKDGRERMFR